MENNKKIKKFLIIGIAFLIFLRVVFLFSIHYLPHTETYAKYNDYILVARTGDDLSYYNLAKGLYNFDIKKHAYTLGFPITLVPFLYIFGEDFSDIFVPTAVFNGFFLYSAAIALVILTAYLVLKRVWASLLSGFIFLIFPAIFYILRDFGPHYASGPTWNDFNFMHSNWLTAQSDSLSAFLTMAILFLLLYGMRKHCGWIYYGFIGFLTGFAAMTRVSNAIFILAAALVIFLYKKYSALSSFIVFSVIGFLPQFIYNAAMFGSPLRFDYQRAYLDWIETRVAERPVFSIESVIHLISRAVDYSWLSIPAFIFIFGAVFIGALYVYRLNKNHAYILALWFILPTLFYMSFTSGQTTFRYYLPAIAPFIILLISSGLYVFEIFKNRLLSRRFSARL